MTDAERRLWNHFRQDQLGMRFRRQEPFEGFILDFVCYSAKLVIEIDGGQHADPNYGDAKRDQKLQQLGFRVLRFWNNEVLENTVGVLERITEVLRQPPPPQPSPIEGEGTRSRQRVRKNASFPARGPAVGKQTEARRHEL
jgi:very-short-patch-repair endonuclease